MSSQGAVEGRAPKAPLGGRLAWWPFAAALGGVAVVVLIVVLVGKGSTGSRQGGTELTASGAVECPQFFENADGTDRRNVPWVPARPAGVASPKNMVPRLHPTHVTVCQYLTNETQPKSIKLTGQRELSGRLDSVVDTLRTLPRARKSLTCSSPSDPDDYLIGLRYDEAIVWVSAPGIACYGASNGIFHTDHNLAAYAAASYAARTWVSHPG